ncbi:MAG: TIGR00725 family protein [Deltaproteobacteria bacterium]|nr:TIGR00725 family protein [Deltaproteobacteria bacterium]
MPARTHRIVIGVMGPAACDPQTAEIARAVGRGIAERGGVLLCGGRSGVMEAAAAGAREAAGLTIGILPGMNARESAPNPHIDIALFTGLGEGRNWLNVCASDAVIAIGGGFGTLSEIALALKAQKRVVLVGSWRFEIEGVVPNIPRASSAVEAVGLAFAGVAETANR